MSHQLHEENRLSWNAATEAHNSHKGDQAAFFRNGGNKLYPEERDLLGDITGLSLVHLQCNAGQDTLSLARLGAIVTGVDISDTAITFARQLAQESGIPATFYRSDIYDWLAETARGRQRFDIVFCSYGAICWLSDLQRWARGIAAILKPGGRFVMVDFHPAMGMFNERMERFFPYSTQGQAYTWEEGVGDYVAMSGLGLADTEYVEGMKDFKNPHRVHEFAWGLGEVVTVLLNAQLQLTSLQEYFYSNGFKPFHDMRLDGRRWYLPEGQPAVPLMYGISASRPR